LTSKLRKSRVEGAEYEILTGSLGGQSPKNKLIGSGYLPEKRKKKREYLHYGEGRGH